MMIDDYLWDRSGKPDPEIRQLEKLLGRFRSVRTELDLADLDREEPANQASAVRRGRWWPAPFLAAAAVLVVSVGALLLFRGSEAPAWTVTRIDGSPTAGSRAIADTGSLRLGEWLETDGSSRARVSVGDIGEIEVDPGTRLRLVAARPSEHRLALARGTIHAFIVAPPRRFFVETASATAVDLGCAYTLEVDAKGAGILRVSMGWVGFEADGRESFIPAGAMCLTRPDVGPGTPHYQDASAKFRSAVARLDFAESGVQARGATLDELLSEARPMDAFTLWHLLSRLEDAERERVFDRMAELVAPPEGVTRQGVLRGDREMLERWWDELGLEDTEWWRVWKLPEPPV